MTRTELLNKIIDKYGYNSYLEIGVANGENLRQVKASYKAAVDPYIKMDGVATQTSDEFFAKNKKKFDLIFIDGDHEEDSVTKDIANAIEALNDGGRVVLHDALPHDEWLQRPKKEFRKGEAWCGTAWRAIFEHAKKGRHLVQILDEDYGCAVITPHLKGERSRVHGELNYKDHYVQYKQKYTATLEQILSVPTFNIENDQVSIKKKESEGEGGYTGSIEVE